MGANNGCSFFLPPPQPAVNRACSKNRHGRGVISPPFFFFFRSHIYLVLQSIIVTWVSVQQDYSIGGDGSTASFGDVCVPLHSRWSTLRRQYKCTYTARRLITRSKGGSPLPSRHGIIYASANGGRTTTASCEKGG